MGAQIRAMSLERIVQELTGYMSGWMLLEEEGDDILLYPAVGSWSAAIPPLIGTSGARRRKMIRWKMNKLGFLNSWLYDEEEFPLHNGHILLRGE